MRADRDTAYVEYISARQNHLRRMAYAICGSWHQADDLLQTAFVKLYVAWPRMHKAGAEDAYVRRILVRAHIDESRRPWRRETSGLEGFDAADPGPEEAEDADERHDLVAVLQQLPAMQRKVVVLRHLFDLSIEETARDLEIRPGTVKSHDSRGLTRLQTLLSQPDLVKD